jgi:hypothetical protein
MIRFIEIHFNFKLKRNDSVQILCLCTLSFVLFLSKYRPVCISKHNVSETGLYLRLSKERESSLRRDRIQSPKHCVLNYKQDGV